MKERNVLDKIMVDIEITKFNDIIEILLKSLNNVDKIYSYLVYVNYNENDELIGWTIQFNISQIDRYNTLEKLKSINNILDIISSFQKKDETKYIIGYEQPPLDLVMELFDALLCKLARIQCDKWPCLDYEDVCQDYRLVAITLYNKGYYLHKRLIEKSCVNKTLQDLSKDKDVTFVSLDSPIKSDGEDKDLCLKDMIADKSIINEEQDKDSDECWQQMWNEIKDYIVDKYGERMLDQLLRAYGTRTTDYYSQQIVHKMRKELEKSGTLEYLKNKYYGRK